MRAFRAESLWAITRSALGLLAFLAINGCIGQGNEPLVLQSQQASSIISGSAFKGGFVSGTARARALTAAGALGAELGTSTVAADATFQINIGTHAGPVHILVESGSFDDEIDGPVTQTVGLTAVLASAAGNPTVVVTPLTHMATAIALRDISVNSTAPDVAITAANAQIAGYYKITSMLSTQPAVLSAGPAIAGNAANYGALLAAISKQADDLGIASDVLAGVLASDAAEGTFDGLSGGTPLAAGAGNLPPAAGRAVLATAITDFLASGANTSTLVAADFTPLLNRLAAVPPEILFVESVAVTPADKTIAQGMQVTYVAMAALSDGTMSDVSATATWQSSDTNIAQITGTSSALAGANAGPTTVSAMAGGATGQTTLTVGNFTLTSLAVTPATPTLKPGDVRAFTATATYSDASTDNISDIVTWLSSAPTLMTVNAQGLASTVAVGSATITATEEGTLIADSTVVTITVKYSTDIQPILNVNCITCHSGPGAPLALRLTNYSFLITGSQNGPVVIAGDPDNSEIIKRLEGTKLPRMPNEAPPLPQSTINLVRAWIALGAPNN